MNREWAGGREGELMYLVTVTLTAPGHGWLKFALGLKIYGCVCVKETVICLVNNHNEATVLLPSVLGVESEERGG